MPHQSITDHRRQAESLVSRLGDLALPKTLSSAASSFKASASSFEKAATVVDNAALARDAALAEVGKADDALDASVDALVVELPAAGLSPRTKPLKGFSSKSPTDLKAMAYAAEATEVAVVVKKVLAKKPRAAVVAACKACAARAADVEAKLRGYGKAQAAYDKALAARDAGLLGLKKATDSLRRHAAVAWEDDAATFKAVFGGATRLEAPKKKRAPKPAKPPAPAPPADPGGDPA